MTLSRRPLPQPDRETGFYWESARRHHLTLLRCEDCGSFVHYPKPECSGCGGKRLRPTRVSGKGIVHSFTVTHYVSAPGFEDAVPFVVALIEIDEQPGIRVVSNMVECQPHEVAIGMPVEVVFQDVTEEVTLPQFRPCTAART
jgi:uncharacterized OB-fold protein